MTPRSALAPELTILETRLAALEAEIRQFYRYREPNIALPVNDPIIVQNGSEEAVPPFGLMRIVSRTFAGGSYRYSIDKPNTTFQRQILVNGPNEIPAGKTGIGAWLEKADYFATDSTGSGTDAVTGQVWGPKPGQWTASRYYHGLLVTGGVEEYTYTPAGGSETTLRIVKGRQYIPQHVLCKTASSIALNASGTLKVWVGAAGSEADSTMSLTAYNRVVAIDSGKWCWAIYSGEVAYLSPIEC